MSVVYLFISYFFICVTCQEVNDFGILEIVSDLLPEDCFKQNFDYSQDAASGLPACVTPFDSHKACSKFLKEETEMVYKPTSCAKDGTFDPKQCKGERTTGRCFCFDKNGHRIFGQQWWAQADDMTCACSRRKADMAGDPYFNSLHCDSVGNYETLQCDIVSAQCWCADEKTGDLTAPVVPQVAISKLPCYSSLNLGTQYLRQCENKKYAQKTIEHQLELRGTISTFGDLMCDEDGSYGAYSLIEGSLYCTWRDNSKLGSWSTSENIVVNCNCARDTKIFQDAGKSQLLKCEGSGNYKEYQVSGTKGYCVDSDGYKKSYEEVTSEDDCIKYTSYADE